MDSQQLIIGVLVVLLLLAFGVIYSLLVAYLHRHHYERITVALLPMSCVFVVVPVLISGLAIGWTNVAWVLGALTIATIPLCLILGSEIMLRLRNNGIELK